MLQSKYIKWILSISALSVIIGCGGGGSSKPKIDIADYMVAESMNKQVQEDKKVPGRDLNRRIYSLANIVSETADGYRKIVSTKDDGSQISNVVIFDDNIQFYNKFDEPMNKKYTRFVNIGDVIWEESSGEQSITCTLEEQSEDKQKIKIKCIADLLTSSRVRFYTFSFYTYYKNFGLLEVYDPNCYTGEGRDATIDDHKLEDGTCPDDKKGYHAKFYRW